MHITYALSLAETSQIFLQIPHVLLKLLEYNNILKYIPLTLYPSNGSRDISDISPEQPNFTKMSY
jgi:hypothetical protein